MPIRLAPASQWRIYRFRNQVPIWRKESRHGTLYTATESIQTPPDRYPWVTSSFKLLYEYLRGKEVTLHPCPSDGDNFRDTPSITLKHPLFHPSPDGQTGLFLDTEFHLWMKARVMGSTTTPKYQYNTLQLLYPVSNLELLETLPPSRWPRAYKRCRKELLTADPSLLLPEIIQQCLQLVPTYAPQTLPLEAVARPSRRDRKWKPKSLPPRTSSRKSPLTAPSPILPTQVRSVRSRFGGKP